MIRLNQVCPNNVAFTIEIRLYLCRVTIHYLVSPYFFAIY